jgi:hypothetical protein
MFEYIDVCSLGDGDMSVLSMEANLDCPLYTIDGMRPPVRDPVDRTGLKRKCDFGDRFGKWEALACIGDDDDDDDDDGDDWARNNFPNLTDTVAKMEEALDAVACWNEKKKKMGWECTRPVASNADIVDQIASCEYVEGGKFRRQGDCLKSCQTLDTRPDDCTKELDAFLALPLNTPFSKVKVAWRKASLKCHPDKQRGNKDGMACLNYHWDQWRIREGLLEPTRNDRRPEGCPERASLPSLPTSDDEEEGLLTIEGGGFDAVGGVCSLEEEEEEEEYLEEEEDDMDNVICPDDEVMPELDEGANCPPSNELESIDEDPEDMPQAVTEVQAAEEEEEEEEEEDDFPPCFFEEDRVVSLYPPGGSFMVGQEEGQEEGGCILPPGFYEGSLGPPSYRPVTPPPSPESVEDVEEEEGEYDYELDYDEVTVKGEEAEEVEGEYDCELDYDEVTVKGEEEEEIEVDGEAQEEEEEEALEIDGEEVGEEEEEEAQDKGEDPFFDMLPPLPVEADEGDCMDKCKRLQEYMRSRGCAGIVQCRKRPLPRDVQEEKKGKGCFATATARCS